MIAVSGSRLKTLISIGGSSPDGRMAFRLFLEFASRSFQDWRPVAERVARYQPRDGVSKITVYSNGEMCNITILPEGSAFWVGILQLFLAPMACY
jgi:hypothetical protein